ncbi:MAG: helix-turn-helix domain-containing protein [Bacteroidota bacterium]
MATALALFAKEGYTATSTAKIAKEAGVSEGLIFRHYENKKGLLDAIMSACDIRLERVLMHILDEEDPQQVICKAISLPFVNMDNEEEVAYWKLQFKLKWDQEYNNPEKMKPLLQKLSWAFRRLGNPNPDQEAALVSHITESISTEILRGNLTDPASYQAFLLEKYNC